MLETAYENPFEKMLAEDWATLTGDEKAFCFQYQRVMYRDGKTSPAMINRMTELFEKYPDINIIACIPKRHSTKDQ